MTKKPAARRTRDPAWRTRRALGAKRVESAKSYDRAAIRKAEREAQKRPPPDEENDET